MRCHENRQELVMVISFPLLGNCAMSLQGVPKKHQKYAQNLRKVAI